MAVFTFQIFWVALGKETGKRWKFLKLPFFLGVFFVCVCDVCQYL